MGRPAPRIPLVLLVALALGGSSVPGWAATPAPAGARQGARDFRLLQAWLAGSFSSRAQAARDTSFRDVRMHVADIWPGRPGGRWYYVEQALAGHGDAPDRQWVCRLTLKDDGRCEAAVFALPAPSRFAGAWREPASKRLAGLTADSLSLREGCAVYLRRQGDHFAGATEGTGCAGAGGGVDHVTVELEVRADRLVLRERRFAGDGTPVGGPEVGASELVRLSEGGR